MNKYEQLIDRLADKTLSFGCIIRGVVPDGIKVAYMDGERISATKAWANDYKHWKDTPPYSPIIIGHPVTIGRVLDRVQDCIFKEALEANAVYFDDYNCRLRDACLDLCRLWHEFGFTKSLNEILANGAEGTAREYEDGSFEWNRYTTSPGKEGMRYTVVTRLKDPNAEALFQFLFNLFP